MELTVEEQLIRELYENDEETIHCSLCGSSVRRALYSYSLDDRRSRIYRCASCGFMFLHPLLLETMTARHMDTLDDAELFNNKLLKMLHEDFIVKREIRIVRKRLGKDRFSMLDIGCGTGWTSSIWKRAGIDVTGLEPSRRRAALAEERYGLTVIPSYIEQLDAGTKYDVIVMRHIIEHIDAPLSVLSRVRSHLESNGLAVIVVPNIDCMGRFVFGAQWSWVLPWHCNFFSPSSVKELMQRAGFDVVQLYQTPSPLWYPQSFLRLFRGSQNLSRRLYGALNLFSLLPFAPLVFLGYLLGLSDNITVIARKRAPDDI